MSSCLRDAITETLTAIKAVPYTWTGDALADRSIKNRLFQKVLMWNDQVNAAMSGKGYLFERPACFLELTDMEGGNVLEGVTLGDYIWRLHIVDGSFDAGDEEGMDENIDVILYRDAVKKAMSGFQPANCSAFFQAGERQDYSHTNLYHYIIDFKSCFEDTKGSSLDPDQDIYIYKEPPTDLELNAVFDPITVE